MINKIFKIVKIIKLKKMFPSLPTDNLYKFCFVGSIFLLGLLVFLRHNEYDRLLSLKTQYEKEATYLVLEIDSYKNGNDTLSTNKKALNKRIAEINIGVSDTKRSIEKFNDESFYSKILYLILSICIMIFACLWYCKLQKYQDKIIKKQADEFDIPKV